ncbi:thiamine pyrophosphate-dependent dehydrogenase E1 component subunit alpha [Bradyrhizobium sp. STM 3557]|uniref:thiamine pyrophosphate-dependent dehydrogenase E1 component subunit alpha n=1 Tax=Bradyrhizobium sp. STM 3557 TaxID=578920 RepID=UPI00388D6E96
MDQLILERTDRLAAPSSWRAMLDLYRLMCRIRAFEIAAEKAAAEGHIRGMIHSAVGQEAVAAGVCGNLRREDVITSTHRNHHHALAKGVNPTAMMAELFGREIGVCKGKGGSMHIADFAVGMIGANGVVAASISIAAGAAQALRMKGSDAISVAFFGDGGMNRGQCLEAFNYVAVNRLPVLLVCEDNGWAATTRTSSVSAGPGMVSRARALGIEAESVDGNDIEAVDQRTRVLVDLVRSGSGPRLLHCLTYRLRGHTCADQATYRPKSEVETRWRDDPIERCRELLSRRGTPPHEIELIRAEEEDLIAVAVAQSLAAAWPDAGEAYLDVQTAGAAS